MRLRAIAFAAALLPMTALAEPPVDIISPDSGFASNGSLQLVVKVSKGFYENVLKPYDAADATVSVSVAGCTNAPWSFSIANAGNKVTPVALNAQGKPVGGYLWTVDVDLSSCQCSNAGKVIHHCDGCGRSFDTSCSGETGSCSGPRDVVVTLSATNKPGNNACEGTYCDTIGGTLLPGEGELVEKYVPENFWELQSDGSRLCVTRSNSGAKASSCKPQENQGGNSCE